MLASSVLAIMALVSLVERVRFYTFIVVVLFVLIFLLTILAISILNNNYPDVPVSGRQKNNFNRLFLVNFIFLVFLFGIIFAEYRSLSTLAAWTGKSILELPFEFLTYLIGNLVVLIFQFIIFYGLYHLRRELYINFTKKEFDFEKNQLL
jgi:hypothetical protein